MTEDLTYLSICLRQTVALYKYLLGLFKSDPCNFKAYRIASKARNRFFRIRSDIFTRFGIQLYHNGLVV